jgi:Ca-activated chloride channel family protein
MVSWAKIAAFILLSLSPFVNAQVNGIGQQMPPTGGMRPPSTTSENAFDVNQVDLWFTAKSAEEARHRAEDLIDNVSKLDLKAPASARREYEKGRRSLFEKNFDEAVQHLTQSVSIYPGFVAAHNALGSAYLRSGHNEEAEREFAQAVSLDDHLPSSFLNLGRAHLALRNFSAARESIQKASALAPLDVRLLAALTYAQFLNHDYADAVATAHTVHSRKHESAAIVHYFAAAAWQGQNNLQETENELRTFLSEDPKSAAAEPARQMIERIIEQRNKPKDSVTISYSVQTSDSDTPPGTLPDSFRRVLKQLEQQKQVAEVEADADAETDAGCESCAPSAAGGAATPNVPKQSVVARVTSSGMGPSIGVLHSTVNEVALLFAATDHGKSITDLTRDEVIINDDGKPPASVIDFRNESQLPLRLGLVIDSSSSITEQFAFEQKAATSFLHRTVADKNDLAFVVGFSSTVLMVQDFTGDETSISHGVGQLAPGGGTAAWDAVKFAAEKLASHQESGPVARILVVISDGDDNASTTTLKQAMETAERGEVTVYTVSTREFAGETANGEVADRAMKALALGTGGAAFFPDSLGNLDRRLADIQQVIRSRYLISYKPADFRVDGKYRSIAVVAQKSGHKLRVYARRGYYANARSVHESP